MVRLIWRAAGVEVSEAQGDKELVICLYQVETEEQRRSGFTGRQLNKLARAGMKSQGFYLLGLIRRSTPGEQPSPQHEVGIESNAQADPHT